MSTAAHSSHDDGLKWSREEISAWLDAQCPELQKTCRELGRKWAQEGRDLVASSPPLKSAYNSQLDEYFIGKKTRMGFMK
jgi:hypothetical protein